MRGISTMRSTTWRSGWKRCAATVDFGGGSPHPPGRFPRPVRGHAMTAELAATIDDAWETRDKLGPGTTGAVRDAVEAALDGLDSGRLRVAEKTAQGWQVNQYLKKAVLLSFRLYDNALIPGGPGEATAWFDKVPSKFAGWGENRFKSAGFRAVPNAVVRRSAFIAPGVVL